MTALLCFCVASLNIIMIIIIFIPLILKLVSELPKSLARATLEYNHFLFLVCGPDLHKCIFNLFYRHHSSNDKCHQNEGFTLKPFTSLLL